MIAHIDTDAFVTIEDALVAMRHHTAEHPDHAINCACKDSAVQWVRGRLLGRLLMPEWNLVASRVR